MLGKHGRLHWRRDNELDQVPNQMTRCSVFSYCGRLLGHYPVCGWLRVAVAFIKRRVNHLTTGWDTVIFDEQLRGFLEETAS